MSFGFSIGDFFSVIALAKRTLDNCKEAPADFAEASKTVQSLQILLESVEAEIQSPTSIFRRDTTQAEHFGNLIRLCEGPLSKLNGILVKLPSLGTANVKPLDRFRFSKKAVLEVRGELALRCANLSAFLDTVGLGGIGRIESKIDGICDIQSKLLEAVDKAVAEARQKRNTASYLSDHSNDEKSVWKQLRSDLNAAGFKSADVERYKAAILTKLKELKQYGLLDSDVASSANSEATIDFKTPKNNMGSESPEGSVTPYGTTTPTLGKGVANAASPAEQIEASQCRLVAGHPLRIWKGRLGNLNLKARFVRKTDEHVYIETAEKEEIVLPFSNLTEADVEHIAGIVDVLPDQPPSSSVGEVMSSTYSDVEYVFSSPAVMSNVKAKNAGSMKLDEDLDFDTEIRTGRRTRTPARWIFRRHDNIEYLKPKSEASLFSDALPKAASKGKYEKVQRLLYAGERIESTGPESYTYTTGSGDNLQTHHVNFPETTALHRAAGNGHFDVCEFLLKHGANPDTTDRGLFPILYALVRRGEADLVRLLLEYGATLYTSQPLQDAASRGITRVVKVLLEHGARIDGKNKEGETALYLASWKGHSRTVEALLKEGANVSLLAEKGQSALYKAAGRGNSDVVRLLLMYGADIYTGTGQAGETILYKAARLGHEETVRLLLRRGITPDIENATRDEPYGSTGDFLVGVLRPLEPPKNEYGQRPLYAAARLGHSKIVELLLHYGADVNGRPLNGLPAVYIAAEMGHSDVVDILLNSGAQLLDRRFIDPVARHISSDGLASIQDIDEKTKPPVTTMTEFTKNFREFSLTEGGDGFKALAKLAKSMSEGTKRNDKANQLIENIVSAGPQISPHISEKGMEQAKRFATAALVAYGVGKLKKSLNNGP